MRAPATAVHLGLMLDTAQAKEFATRARGQMREGNPRLAIALLAQAFHSLEHAGGLEPWDAEALYHWSVENLRTDAELNCARFILSLWDKAGLEELDAEHGDQLGRFDALDAIARWDHAHRAAFATWTADPWWP